MKRPAGDVGRESCDSGAVSRGTTAPEAPVLRRPGHPGTGVPGHKLPALPCPLGIPQMQKPTRFPGSALMSCMPVVQRRMRPRIFQIAGSNSAT
jgi:hypothetical protein